MDKTLSVKTNQPNSWTIFNCTNFATLAVVLYFAIAFQQLFKLANPLHGLHMDSDALSGPIVQPLWSEGTPYRIVCFLSNQANPMSKGNIDIKKISSEEGILFERDDLIHASYQNELSISLAVKPSQSDSSGVAISNKIFRLLHRNSSSVYLHVLVTKMAIDGEEVNRDVVTLNDISEGKALYGAIQMVKFDIVPKSFKYRYLLSDFGWVDQTDEEKRRLTLPADTVISYWKPEVSVKLVADFASYPIKYIPDAVRKNMLARSFAGRRQKHAASHVYKPAMFADEIGLTSDKYIYLNSTVQELPLKISIAPMASQRWFIMSQLEESLSAQKGFGFSDKDIDDVRRMISDTSVYFLLVTMVASLLHLLFEFLAFKSDINFWKTNKSLAGLSTRTLLTDLLSQLIVFLFLVDSEASLLITVPSFIGILIQAWKVRKATGASVRWGGWTLIRIDFERWKSSKSEGQQQEEEASNGDKPAEIEEQLTKATLEADSFATRYIGGALAPVALAFILRSLIYEKHASWYSWVIGSMTSVVYTFGFVLMCPQLYINHQLKSVSHLPWQYLIYKFLNTFVDDLFAFIIKMPVMHRLSVFRDDIVFLVYLYQRWVYRVDINRPTEK